LEKQGKIDLYSEKGWVETWYDADLGVIRVKWYNYTSRIHLRKSCEMQLEAMKLYKASVIIADAGEAIGVPYPQDQDWFITNLYPKSIEYGLKIIITIAPKNPIARSGAKTWNSNGKRNGINYVEVETMEEAFHQLKMYNNSLIKDAY
jgi:hypothetical protein